MAKFTGLKKSFSDSSSFFNRIAHSAGLSVSATSVEMERAMHIVTANCV